MRADRPKCDWLDPIPNNASELVSSSRLVNSETAAYAVLPGKVHHPQLAGQPAIPLHYHCHTCHTCRFLKAAGVTAVTGVAHRHANPNTTKHVRYYIVFNFRQLSLVSQHWYVWPMQQPPDATASTRMTIALDSTTTAHPVG